MNGKTTGPDGLLVIDKPGGLTSRDAVDRALAWFPRGTRVGHTGTLDPLATGVLVLCVGVATRLTEYVQQMDKTYRAGLRLGARSDTDDADGSVELVPGAQVPDRETVLRWLEEFVGTIEQVPPAFSAAKVTGRRAYDLARQGKEVVLQPRPVRIYGIDVRRYEYPHLDLEVRCGKGTYIRSLARDLGERLGSGALIESLRRTRVGPFGEADALPLDADSTTARSRLLPVAAAVFGLPHVTLPAAEVERLRRGQRVPLSAHAWLVGEFAQPTEIAVLDDRGQLVTVALADPGKGMLRPVKVFAGS